MPLKVAIFTDTYYPQVNGVAQTLKRLTDHLEDKQISYQLYSPENDDHSTTYPNLQQFRSLPTFLYPECRTVITNPKKIEVSLKQFQPDIIHLATPYMMGLYGLFAAKKLNIPVVSSYHTNFDQYLKYYHASLLAPFLWKYLKWFHQSTEKIFVPSMDTKRKLQTRGFYSLELWGRGINCDIFQPYPNEKQALKQKYKIKEEYILLYVGRLAPEKDLVTLNNVIEQLPDHMSDSVHWLIVGDGPNKEMWEAKAAEQENITVTGYIKGEDLAKIYAGGDLFIFPSFTETFGNVVLESLACGTPAVVSNVGGVTEIVENEKNGIICEKENVEQFTNAITELLSNSERREKMGINARDYALTQSWNNIFNQLVDDYKEVILSKNIIDKRYA